MSCFNRRYWAVVAVEVVALLVGLVIINRVLDADRFAVAWVAVVVGVHFFVLGSIWRARPLYVVGAVLASLGLAGFIVGAASGSAAAIALVSGVGSGAVLFIGVGLARFRGRGGSAQEFALSAAGLRGRARPADVGRAADRWGCP